MTTTQIHTQVECSIIENVSVAKSLEDDSVTSSTDEDQSFDTQEAFFEMLGLSSDAEFLLDEEEHSDDEHAQAVEIVQIDLPRRCSRYLHTDCVAFTLDPVLSESECKNLIQLATSSGFNYVKEATHTGPDGKSYSVQLQNPNPHKLCVLEHSGWISHLWSKLRGSLFIENFISRTKCGPPLGLNPRLRILKYDANDNDRFEPHFDATTKVGDSQSLLTVLVYLNDGGGSDFEGGETLFLNYSMSGRPTAAASTPTKVVPTTGKVVIFEHDLFHSGAPLEWGTKYILRTDVMFATKEQVCNNDDEESWNISEETCSTVFHLCQQLGIPQGHQDTLDLMDMLHITVDSFVAPGITVVTRMLQDELNDKDSTNRLIKAALEIVRERKR